MLREFLAALFEPQDLIEIRFLPSGDQQWFDGPDQITAEDVAAHLDRRNADGQNVYFGANPRSTRGGRREHVAIARSLCADFDSVPFPECAERIEKAGLPAPTCVVASGRDNGYQVWWRLESPITDLAEWERLQAALIAAVKSDPKVKDAPRVMRLPGYINHKWNRRALVMLVNENRHAAEPFAALPVPALAMAAPLAEFGGASGFGSAPYDGAPLVPAMTRATASFLASGAPEGERNQTLFRAAADLAGCGLLGPLRGQLIDAARRSGLPDDEIESTIRSACARPRSPARFVADRGGESIAVAPATNGTVAAIPTSNAPTPAPAPAPAPATALPRGGQVCLSNVVLGARDPETGARRIYARQSAEILADIQTITRDGLRTAGGVLFGDGITRWNDQCPTPAAICWLGDSPDLFAWLSGKVSLHWAKAAQDSASRDPRTCITKAEFFSYAKQNVAAYHGIELLPHHPPVAGVYYAGSDDGHGWRPPEPQGRLWELLDMLNGATEIDATLLRAMFLTPAWGGQPGCRPIFVLDSPGHGQGSGKTVTAELVSLIYGQAISIGKDEKIEDIRKRLLGESSTGRVVLLDNAKGRQDSAGIESLVTAPVINGHRMYVGNASRPNLFTYIVTANAPRLSKDLAERSVIIHIGASRHTDANFVERARNFVLQHRASMIADAVAALRSDPVCAIDTGGRDRWGSWQNGVLARCQGGDDAAIETKARRAVVDVDTEDAEDIAAAIIARIGGADQLGVQFTPEGMRQTLVNAGCLDRNMSVKAMTTILVGLAGVGPLKLLSRKRYNHGRMWQWGEGFHGLTIYGTEQG